MIYQHNILHTQRMKWCFSIVSFVSIFAVSALVAQTDDFDDDENIYVLSPFEVDASGDIGYYAENTLAGSRLNTKISDLAASITVINIEQMEDTASVDINDILRYEANTEGSDTYTEGIQSLRNDGVVDTNAGFTHGANGQTQSHNTANRIRGIGRPGTTVNYYPALTGVPFDSYNTASVEIARGPNSLLFGMGNPAGIVNQSTATATIGQDFTKIKLRFDDRGSVRSSLSFNRGLLDDKLAVYISLLKDDREFIRKPSYDNTERAYAAITYKPLKGMTIRANIESYSNDNRRPNTLTPLDSVTEWRNGGMWGYNPSNGMLTNAAGDVKGPLSLSNKSPIMDDTRAWIASMPGYDASLWDADQLKYNGVNIYGGGALTNPDSALYTPGLALGNSSRPKFRMYDGGLTDYLMFNASRYRLGYGNAEKPEGNADYSILEEDIFANPVSAAAYNTGFSTSDFYSADYNGIGSYRYSAVTDKSIYDWTDVNTLAMNFGEKSNTTYNVELEQQILSDLTLSVGFFQQDFEEMTNYTVSQLNASTIYVDTNTHLADGSVNQMFGLPMMIGPADPDRFETTVLNKTYRAMLAYTPDFTGNDGWTKWLGRHQAVGLVSKYNTVSSLKRKRYYIEDSDEGVNQTVMLTRNPNDYADGSPTGWKLENRSVQRLWYLASPGDAQNGAVTQAADEWNNASYEGNMQYFNYESNSWEEQRYKTAYLDHSAHTGRAERDVESMSFGLTSFLWNDRLVTTMGWRKDDYRGRSTSNGIIYEQDRDENGELVVQDVKMSNQEKWVDGYYQTETVFNRWNRWDEVSGSTSTMGAVIRPFDKWDSISSEFLRSLGFSYNKSDNFNPPSSAQVDAFGKELPKPTGTGEDWGIQFSLMENKLFARINWYKASNENERTDPGSSMSRFNYNVDAELFRNWARTITLINMGYDPTVTESWDLTGELSPAEEDEVQAATEVIWGQPYDYYDNLPGAVYATRTAESEGMEIQIVYNPIPNWTIKFSGGKQKTVYSDVMHEFYEWSDYRSPALDAARGVDFLNDDSFVTYTTEGGTEVNLADFWGSYGYDSKVKIDLPDAHNAQEYYDNVVSPQVAIATDLEGQAAKGQRKYRGSIITNYAFVDGILEGASFGGSIRWEDRAVIGYYGRVNPATDSTDLTLADVNKPIYDKANTRYDVWAGYKFQFPFFDGVDARVRLNIVNVFEDGRLQTVAVNYDGSASAYRIIDPRQFILSMDLSF